MRRIDGLAMVSGFLALLLFPGLAPAQIRQGVGIVSTISGQATVSRVSLPQPQPLQFKDSVFDRDRISTGENSTVKVLMGGKALVTVRELSVLTITEELNRSTVDLQSGKIALGVLQQKMRPGEAIEVRTHNAVAAVRGTVIVVEIVRASAQLPGGPRPALTTNVHVIHGSAVVTPTNITGASPITVAQFQTYSQIGNILGTIRPLTPTAVNQLIDDKRSGADHAPGQTPPASSAPGEAGAVPDERLQPAATARLAQRREREAAAPEAAPGRVFFRALAIRDSDPAPISRLPLQTISQVALASIRAV